MLRMLSLSLLEGVHSRQRAVYLFRGCPGRGHTSNTARAEGAGSGLLRHWYLSAAFPAPSSGLAKLPTWEAAWQVPEPVDGIISRTSRRDGGLFEPGPFGALSLGCLNVTLVLP